LCKKVEFGILSKEWLSDKDFYGRFDIVEKVINDVI
jgi:hypothetical protein